MGRVLSSLVMISLLTVASVGTAQEAKTKPLRAGMVGLTTSHVPAFASLLNDPNAAGPLADVVVTAAVPGGMPDNASGWPRREGYTQKMRELGATIYDSMEEMLPQVDVVMVMSVDGRPHLEYARKAILAGKPVFVDKPMAASLTDVLEMFRLAKEHKIPLFSASSLRYSSGFQRMRNEQPLGKVLGCEAFSPCKYEPHHPDLFWYGIHGVETLFTIMGPGCESVTRTTTEGADLVVGVWRDGRIGSFRGTRAGRHSYGAHVWCEKGNESAGTYEGYKPLVLEICKFFKTGVSPIDPKETIEIFAFMEAADESKRRGGCPVSIEEVIRKAREIHAKAE